MPARAGRGVDVSRRVRSCFAALCAVLGLTALTSSPALAEVSAVPASWTPQVTSPDATVRKMVQCGSTMYAVGQFTQVTSGGTVHTRDNAFSFDATTGALTSWNPDVNGLVNSVAVSADCSTVYLGGIYSTIGGANARDIAAVDGTTGALDQGFKHTANGAVYTVALVAGGTQLLVGGAFTAVNGGTQAYYTSLRPSDGAVTPYLTLPISGQLSDDSRTMIYNEQLSPSGQHLLFEGRFTTIAGQSRQQIAELDLGADSATLSSWFHPDTLKPCPGAAIFYIRGAAWSQDEQTIYFAATGGRGKGPDPSPFCDSAAAVTASTPSTTLWINKTGSDSLYAAAAGADEVYVGGHQRWLDNPLGKNKCGAGCVSRPGIGSIDSATGRATAWDPTRDRGEGVQDLLLTTAGLWVSSDTFHNAVKCGHQYHPGICFFPGAG